MLKEKEAEKRLAQEIEKQATSYAVIVDGNSHHLPPIRTRKEQITRAKCQNIVKTIEQKFGIDINTIEIDMNEFDYRELTPEQYTSALYGDYPIRQTKNKKAIYNAKRECLTIWEDGLPVYENYAGQICQDPNALADCLL